MEKEPEKAQPQWTPERRLRELVPFSTHRIELSKNLWTMPSGQGEDVLVPDLRMKTLVDRAGGTLTGKRVLDLGCLEGGYSVCLAKQGAKEVVGIEAREINYQRCLLVKDCLKLPNLTFHRCDVKEARKDWLSEFDIIFAGGILYHLDNPCAVLRQLSEMVKEFLLIDTHVALRDHYAHGCSEQITERVFEGEVYRGRWTTEFQPNANQQEIEKSSWASWSNIKSFWFLEEDLVHLLMRLGFQNVSRVYNTPRYNRCREGCPEGCRIIIVARRNWNLS